MEIDALLKLIQDWTQMVDLGDGSAAERKYKTKKLMEEDVERERESGGGCFCDSTGSESFEIDVETGEIVTEGFFYTPDEY